MSEKQTIQNADELTALLPRQIHGIADAAPYNARRKAVEKEIIEIYWQYKNAIATLKKDDPYGYGRSDAESAFAAQLKKFKTTCDELTKMRAEVLHEPPLETTFAPSMLKVGSLYLQPTTEAAREFNKKILWFAEEHHRELKENTRALERTLVSNEGSDDMQQLARNIAMQKMRAFDAAFAARHQALVKERSELLAATK